MHNCYLVRQRDAPDLDSPNRVECPALVTGIGFTQLVFGYPSEEAYWMIREVCSTTASTRTRDRVGVEQRRLQQSVLRKA